MVLFAIPDIRLFWTDDERFTSQFQAGQIKKFQSYSKYPLCYKDVSFWLPDSGLHPNDVYELIRNEAGDLVERVELIDQVSITYLNPIEILIYSIYSHHRHHHLLLIYHPSTSLISSQTRKPTAILMPIV